MISRRVRDDAFAPLIRGKFGDSVHGAPELKCSHFLEVFAFEEEFGTCFSIQVGRF
jgi:hypothetical protein